jgi:hypothetical protein
MEMKKVNDYKIVPDPKNDIKFWLDALNNPNIDRESKEMLNKCLYVELNNYLYPIVKMVL